MSTGTRTTPRPPCTTTATSRCPSDSTSPRRPRWLSSSRPRCPAPCTPHRVPCTLHFAPCTPQPAPRTLHPAPCTMHPAPRTPHPAPRTLHLAPCTLHLSSTPCALRPTCTCTHPPPPERASRQFLETPAAEWEGDFNPNRNPSPNPVRIHACMHACMHTHTQARTYPAPHTQFLEKSASEWEAELEAFGLPCAKVQSWSEWMRDPDAWAASIVARVDGLPDPQLGRTAWLRSVGPEVSPR